MSVRQIFKVPYFSHFVLTVFGGGKKTIHRKHRILVFSYCVSMPSTLSTLREYCSAVCTPTRSIYLYLTHFQRVSSLFFLFIIIRWHFVCDVKKWKKLLHSIFTVYSFSLPLHLFFSLSSTSHFYALFASKFLDFSFVVSPDFRCDG